MSMHVLYSHNMVPYVVQPAIWILDPITLSIVSDFFLLVQTSQIYVPKPMFGILWRKRRPLLVCHASISEAVRNISNAIGQSRFRYVKQLPKLLALSLFDLRPSRPQHRALTTWCFKSG